MTLGKLKQQVSCIMISVSDECNVCVVCVFEGLGGGGGGGGGHSHCDCSQCKV